MTVGSSECPRFRHVLFDVGGTLIGPRESYGTIYARVLAGLGLERPAEVFDDALRRTWEEMGRLVPAGADRYSWFPEGERGYWLRLARGTLERAGLALDDSLLAHSLEELRRAFGAPASWEVYPEVPAVLDALHRAGARLGVVSNWDSRLPRLLDELGLAHRFHTIVVSHLEGREKPDPALFRVALERLGALAKETLYVGDTPELDLDGARAAGLEAVLVDRRGRLDASHRAIASLAPLPRIVGERHP